MPKSRIAVTLDATTLDRLDRLVRDVVFPNRSRAIETAIREKLERIDKGRLARECARLDPASEKVLAEEGMDGEATRWPGY